MNAALRIVLLGTLFVGAPLASGTASGLAFVALACAAATLVEGRPGPIPIIAGSLGALAAALLGPDAPLLAGAVACAGCWAPRAVRAVERRDRRVLVGLSLLGGALAAMTAQRFGGDASGAVRLAAVAVCGLLASLGGLVSVDESVAARLRWTVLPRREPVDEALARAVTLRRGVVASEPARHLDAATAERLERAWGDLADLAGALAASRERGPAPGWMTARVEAHVEALERAHRTLEDHLARSVRIADHGLDEVELTRETLEEEVRALDEVAAEASRNVPEISLR